MNDEKIKQLITGLLVSFQIALIGYLGENQTSERLIMLLCLGVLPYIRDAFLKDFLAKERSLKEAKSE